MFLLRNYLANFEWWLRIVRYDIEACNMYAYREAKEKDFAEICSLIESEEELFLVYPKGKYPFSISQLRALAEVRKELTIIVYKSEIIGFANFYGYQPDQYVYIGNVIIKQEYRGGGLGRELVLYMLGRAFEKHHLPEVRISVFGDNSPALLLYAGLGFAPYEIEARENPRGDRVALIHMKKLRSAM